jgi:hypothetical protein
MCVEGDHLKMCSKSNEIQQTSLIKSGKRPSQYSKNCTSLESKYKMNLQTNGEMASSIEYILHIYKTIKPIVKRQLHMRYHHRITIPHQGISISMVNFAFFTALCLPLNQVLPPPSPPNPPPPTPNPAPWPTNHF